MIEQAEKEMIDRIHGVEVTLGEKIHNVEVSLLEKITALELRIDQKLAALELRMMENLAALELRMMEKFHSAIRSHIYWTVGAGVSIILAMWAGILYLAARLPKIQP